MKAVNSLFAVLCAFILPLASGAQSVYSTYLGGSGIDQSSSIGLDSQGNIYVPGATFARLSLGPATIQ